MFFNLEIGISTEDDRSIGSPCCWMADGNFWIAGDMEVSINRLPLEEFCIFLESAPNNPQWIQMPEVNGFSIYLEDEDSGDRNLCFYNDRLFIDINMKTENLLALAKFLRIGTEYSGL